MENSLYWSSINTQIKFHTFWTQIALIFDGFVVLFVVVAVVVLSSISL